MPFDGYLLNYSKDGAGCMDTKGNAVWNQTFEMQNPIVDICQNVVAIGDYNGRTIYVMNTGGPMGNITTNRPIRNITYLFNLFICYFPSFLVSSQPVSDRLL